MRVHSDSPWDHGPRCIDFDAGDTFSGSRSACSRASSSPARHSPTGPSRTDPPTVLNLLFGWDFEPAVILPLVGVVIWWWRMLAAIDRDHPDHRVPSRQRWAFLAGLAVIAFALQSGIGRYDTTLFSIHMVQHLMLTLVAPPLLALGAPITQLLRASSSSTRRRWILPFLHSRVISVLSHPVLAWILFAGVMWGTHFSPIFNASLEDPLTHDLEHLAVPDRRAPLLVAGRRDRPVAAPDGLPGPHRVRLPPDAAELVPGHDGPLRGESALPPLRDPRVALRHRCPR